MLDYKEFLQCITVLSRKQVNGEAWCWYNVFKNFMT